MSKLSTDQKSIKELLTDKHADFLIPDYQRPYAWTDDECSTLWDDLFSFAFPNNDCEAFDASTDEYFLGPIVTFKNCHGQQEIIDGQQRLTTIMLLLRAFYDKFGLMKDPLSENLHEQIARCVWKTDEFDYPDMGRLKIDSEVASDNDKDEFLRILHKGHIEKEWRSAYAKNYTYFQGKIAELVNDYPSYTAHFATRVLNNVILLLIEAESQDTALRIFSTLNDRGLPLSDADIFKSQLYKFFSDRGEKNSFIARWRKLEEATDSMFSPMRGTPMDELFTRYMYYERAKRDNRDTTTRALRDFYGQDSYALLKCEDTLRGLEALACFWKRIDDREGFSDDALRRLYVLSYAPNGMWTYLLSVYFLAKRDKVDALDNDKLCRFLDRITAFIYAYAIVRPGVNALRTPVYPEMINIVKGRQVTFANHRFTKEDITARFEAYEFTNGRPITKSLLVWWAFQDERQRVLPADTKLEIEHIYARKRAEVTPLKNKVNLEALGNKAILEKRINIRASDYRFADKKVYYLGDDSKGKKEGTSIHELFALANESEDFLENDIENRTKDIITKFVEFLDKCELLDNDGQ